MPPKARKGPETHAGDTPVGTVAKGNDGKMWVVAETANGVKRWVRHAAGIKAVPKKGSKEYLTHDNGGRSFLVRYNKSEFTVFEPVKEQEDAFYDKRNAERPGALSQIMSLVTGSYKKEYADFYARLKKIFTVPVMTSKYKRVFVGASHAEEIGNTMLFEVDGGIYVCVSQDVASFKPPERIESYESPVHGSDVPYPYAVGAKASYLLGHDQVTVPHSDLKSPDQEPHDVAYFSDVKHLSTRSKKMREYAKAHPLPGYKVVRKRRF
jgi:hypothetical protein